MTDSEWNDPPTVTEDDEFDAEIGPSMILFFVLLWITMILFFVLRALWVVFIV